MLPTTTPYRSMNMIDRTFDPSTLINATREAFAPVLKAQQEGFKSFERLARLQYQVAGDVLESSLARVQATFTAASANELVSKQTELHGQLVEKMRERMQEFSSVTSEIQTKFSQLGTEMAAKAVPVRKAA
ncbi:MAG TPA: phasin family protein [Steroidobacteraceae bacterium]|nr:phasin family protein [Steroidobacteraceae bacterium]